MTYIDYGVINFSQEHKDIYSWKICTYFQCLFCYGHILISFDSHMWLFVCQCRNPERWYHCLLKIKLKMLQSVCIFLDIWWIWILLFGSLFSKMVDLCMLIFGTYHESKTNRDQVTNIYITKLCRANYKTAMFYSKFLCVPVIFE